MLFFRNDYGEGCIEPIARLMKEANEETHPGYGEDDFCRKAAQIIQSKLPDVPSDIHFIVSGTLTNIVMIRHALRSYECVLCCDTAHINEHEAGAIEVGGNKIITMPNQNGKLTASMVRQALDYYENNPNLYIVPRLVYISNATEMGTVYTRQELEELSAVCKERNLYLMMDGARMAPALMSGIDYSLNDIARWCDLFSVGGTKSGALFGEAVVIPNKSLQPYFRYIQKQSGAILAKGWLIGLQFIGLFENDDFYKGAGHANKLAKEIQDEMIELGYPLYMRSTTNQLFVLLEPDQFEYLKERVDFEIWEKWEDQIVIRLVTSWHTRREDVEELKKCLRDAMNQSQLKKQALLEEEELEEELSEESDSRDTVTPQEANVPVY